MQDLGERKTKILYAVIKNYLETGEPVGSRTISKLADLNLSSATIRNEMADLEELGYICQPHTSAGRIPTDAGYRFYVDQLMQKNDEKVAEMENFVIEKTDKLEKMLQQVVKVLAANTNYASLITAPSTAGNKIKFIQLSAVDEEQVLAVIVMEGNIVKNKILAIQKSLDNETLLKLNMLLNTSLNGLTIDEINLGMISRLKMQAGSYSAIISDVLDGIAAAFHEDEDLEIYTSGATNLFKYPELSDSAKATELLSTFEEKEELASLISDVLHDENETGIQVYIGNETTNQKMKDCSVVTTTYELGEGMQTVIGIVGPKRMDYENVMDNLKILKGQLDNIFKKPKGIERDHDE